MLAMEERSRMAKYILSVSALVISLLAYAFTGGQVELLPASKWGGYEIFNEKGCTQCHTVHGKGGNSGPDLSKQKYYGTFLGIASLMWNHFPKMYEKMENSSFQFPELNIAETTQLISYLCCLRFTVEPGRDYRGRKLLKSMGCIKCHKYGGQGGEIGPDFSTITEYLSPIILVEAMWNHGPNVFDAFQEHDIKHTKFKGDDIVDLAAALRTYMPPTGKVPVGYADIGDPEKGKMLVEEKKCIYCHSFRGVGGNVGPDFAEVDLDYSVTQIAGKMWNHGPDMWKSMKSMDISFPVFEKGEMVHVVTYLYWFKLEDKPGDAEEGRKIIAERGCLACHSLPGTGAGVRDLSTIEGLDSPLGMITAMWNHAPAMQNMFREKKLKWPKMSGRDMANLHAYLNQLALAIESGE